TRELFPRKTGPTLDPAAAAEAAAAHTIGLILEPARCARLVEQAARDPKQPGFGQVLDDLLAAGWQPSGENAYHAEIRRAVDNVILHRLMRLIATPSAADSVKA